MATGLGLQTRRLRLLRARRLGPWAVPRGAGDESVGPPAPIAPIALVALVAPVDDRSLPPPSALSRLARVNLDLTFRGRGEAALVRVAFYGHGVARLTIRGSGLFLLGALAAFPVLPLMSGLLALGGLVLLGLSAVAKTTSLAAHIPARATRALRLQGWSTPTAGAAGSPDGGRVRVRGRITALRTVPALDGGPAVYVTVRATRNGRGTELHKAQDFLLDDGTGVPTRVEVAHALLLDRPIRLFGSWNSPPLETFRWIPAGTTPVDLEEAALMPGDEVEVIGRAEMVVDPSMADRMARDTPLVRVLSGTPDEPLLLRSLELA